MLKKILLRLAILVPVGLLIGGGVAWYQMKFDNARVMKSASYAIEGEKPTIRMAGLEIGGPFTLTDHNGNKVTEADFAGKFQLIYFGFTYCPAICPTELQRMTQIMNQLPADYSDKIQPIFITVDPERDTPELMKNYVSLFHEDLVGLTGTRPQIDYVLKAYRIFAARVDDPDLSDYTMDHSTFTYFMGPDNKLLSIYRMKDEVDFILNDIKAKILAARTQPQDIPS